jgi:hypothetical protein
MRHQRTSIFAAALLTVLLASGCADMGSKAGSDGVALNGSKEVPPNPSAATGLVRIAVAADHAVSGGLTTKGIEAKAAHIHQAAPGMNGPVIVGLTKAADDSWIVPPGAKLTDDQYASYQAGNLYVNVHSAQYPGGEIRAQLNSK